MPLSLLTLVTADPGSSVGYLLRVTPDGYDSHMDYKERAGEAYAELNAHCEGLAARAAAEADRLLAPLNLCAQATLPDLTHVHARVSEMLAPYLLGLPGHDSDALYALMQRIVWEAVERA